LAEIGVIDYRCIKAHFMQSYLR